MASSATIEFASKIKHAHTFLNVFVCAIILPSFFFLLTFPLIRPTICETSHKSKLHMLYKQQGETFMGTM